MTAMTPLDTATIILTRRAADNAPLRAQLEARGAQVLDIPMVEIRPVPLKAPPDAVLAASFFASTPANPNVSTWDWIVVTSRNAAALTPTELLMRPDTACKIAAVGAATAAALRDRGVFPHLVGDGSGALRLWDQLASRYPMSGARILHPCSTRTDDRLVHSARNSGAQLTQMPVYETICPIDAYRDDLPEGAIAVFYSPSAVAHYLKTTRVSPAAIRAVACGATTGQALARAGVETMRIATGRDVVSVLAAISSMARHDRKD